MKTLTDLSKGTDKLPIPRCVQDVIPISILYDDGIFKQGQVFTKTYSFTDINYAVASEEEEEEMCRKYNAVLNMFETGQTTKITVEKRQLNRRDFEKTALMPYMSDDLDKYRKEKNDNILSKISGENGYVLHKYITLQCNEKSVDNARQYFARQSADITRGLKTLGSICMELDANERLRIIHDFYYAGGDGAYYDMDVKQIRKRGHSFKDYICPDSMEFKPDYFKFGERYGRVLFLREYGSYVPDNIVNQLSSINNNFILSIDIAPVPNEEARNEVQRRLLGIETNKANWQRKQNKSSNYSATVPYEIEQQEKDTKEFLYDLDHRDQRMTLSVITIVHTAATKKELDDDTKSIRAAARNCHCQLGILRYQQMDGLNTALPYGCCNICNFRTLTTENLDAFTPFYVQDVFDTKGIYYGQNVKNRNLIIVDREKLMNGNAVILGTSGSGKSFAAKDEITSNYLTKDVDILIIDPEREYTKLVNALGGEVINISATSNTHINALDMTREYGLDENGKDYVDPIILKSEFVMSLCEQAMGKEHLSAQHASIVDRCTRIVYYDYIRRGYTGQPPTLKYFRRELLNQSEPEAQELALALEKFTEGSLNTFARPTNINTQNRLICYDILELGKQLMPIGMLVILDSIFNRITLNRRKGRKTYIYIDEIYLLFQNEYSATFLSSLWKRVRKYGAFATGITQNVSDLLNSDLANKLLMNSEFVLLFNQKASDRNQLAQILEISSSQMDYITDTEAGQGLLKISGSLIPFVNRFPKNTELYRLMTTKPGEN